ncbi:hypothetical protein BT96DRAFT_976681 [Gymnopus androsaceus JB14]|uniref:Uncharacterized protein n=1 Tax=Gymnopus androsaceus JB14 TaxID=1447944 RepID=A0A6A4HH92_9AGAR|nr:hypothetical protein BT96DRAFT_976681 [Gymnopus androsaceus JB14]
MSLKNPVLERSLADISDYNLSWCGNIRMSRDFCPIESVPGIVNHCNFDVPSAATTTTYTRIDSDAELVIDIIGTISKSYTISSDGNSYHILWLTAGSQSDKYSSKYQFMSRQVNRISDFIRQEPILWESEEPLLCADRMFPAFDINNVIIVNPAYSLQWFEGIRVVIDKYTNIVSFDAKKLIQPSTMQTPATIPNQLFLFRCHLYREDKVVADGGEHNGWSFMRTYVLKASRVGDIEQ